MTPVHLRDRAGRAGSAPVQGGASRPRARARGLLQHAPRAPHLPSSGYWKASFPGELPQTPVLPEQLNAAEFKIEGTGLQAVSVGQGDTEHSTVLHVPSAAAVVGGDVVCNGVHMMTAETVQRLGVAGI